MPNLLNLKNAMRAQNPQLPPQAQKPLLQQPRLARLEERPAFPPQKAPQQPQAPAPEKPPQQAPQKPLPDAITWQALEYPQYKRSNDWYWTIGILTLGVATASFILGNVLLGVFVLLAGFTVALFGAKQPRVVTFRVSLDGISIGTRLYPYETLESFWIAYFPPDVKELNIQSQKMLMPLLKLPLGDAKPADIRAYIVQFLPERQREESLIDKLFAYLRF